MQSALNREYRKMFRNLNGIRTMNRLPECLVIVDPKKEKNAVSEAQKLGVATVALIDTDCDPDLVDLPIPGNDDSMRSIELIIKMLADAIVAGKQQGSRPKPARRRRRRSGNGLAHRIGAAHASARERNARPRAITHIRIRRRASRSCVPTQSVGRWHGTITGVFPWQKLQQQWS